MKYTLVTEILEHLIVCGSSIMLEAALVPYGRTLGRTLYEIQRVAGHCPHEFSGHSTGTVASTLSRLKKQGLVARDRAKRKIIWRISEIGKHHFETVAEKLAGLPPEDGKIRLVIFDIPEQERVKRNWLRTRLLACDYTTLQKSVMLGTRPLPKRLLNELKERELSSYVRVVGLEG